MEFLMDLQPGSNLLRNGPNRHRIQRQALLHLVHPDTFEYIVNVNHKEKIAQAFNHFVNYPTNDSDRKLTQIRSALNNQHDADGELFYRPEIRAQWDPSYTFAPNKAEPSDDYVPDNEPEPHPSTEPWSRDNIDTLAAELLWEPRYLRDIIGGLQDKRQAIFQGPPGTGKTFVAKRIAELCKRHSGDFQLVQFHPSYSYEDFVEGHRPTLTDSGQAGFRLEKGPLRRIAEQAPNNPNATHILVIDEINRGNVAKVMGELYFLLEYRDEEIALQYSREPFSLPANLWFIGTMNTTDRSIALVDAALRRRFYFFNFFPDAPPVQGLLSRWLPKHDPETPVAPPTSWMPPTRGCETATRILGPATS